MTPKEAPGPQRAGMPGRWVWFLYAGWFVLGYPVLRWLWIQWRTNDFYSHGLLVFPLAVYLFWRLRPRTAPRGDDRGLVVLLVGTGMYVLALSRHAEYLAAMVWILLGFVVLWSVWGWEAARTRWFPFLFALLAVPLPFVEKASLPLSQWAGSVAGHVVRWFGIPVTINGNQVSLPEANLVVGAQCSGLRSMVALFTLSVLFAFLVRGPWWGRLILVLSALPIALVGNLARVASLLIVAYHWGADVGFRFYHDYSGYVFFLVAFLTLIGIARLVRCNDIRSDIF